MVDEAEKRHCPNEFVENLDGTDEFIPKYPLAYNLMNEIKNASGILLDTKLSEALAYGRGGGEERIKLSGEQISHYLKGDTPMGESRMLHLAKVAKELGWVTPSVKYVLLWFGKDDEEETRQFFQTLNEMRNNSWIDGLDELDQIDPSPKGDGVKEGSRQHYLEALEQYNSHFNEINKGELNVQQKALTKLDQAVQDLVSVGLDDKTIIGHVINLTHKYIEAEERSNGGFISIDSIPKKYIGADGKKYEILAWLEWRYKTSYEIAEFLSSRQRDADNGSDGES